MATNKTTQAQPLANIVVISVVVSLLAVVTVLFVGRMLVDQIILQNKVIDRKTATEKQLQVNREAIDKLATQYDALGNKKTLIEHALPTKPDFPALTALMENLAKASNIYLQSVSAAAPATAAAPPAEADGLTPMAFTIAVQGNYGGIKTLLHNLEASAQPMKVTVISVGGNSTALNVQLSITTYYLASDPLTIKTEVVQ